MWERLCGFQLTDFISNNKELPLSIRETQRKISVKYQDLSGQPPNEKALEICLETGDDAFTFKIKLNKKRLTKSVMLTGIEKLKTSMHVSLCPQKYVCVQFVYAAISCMLKFCMCMCVCYPRTL